MPRMKIRRRFRYLQHPHRRWQNIIHRLQKISGWDRRLGDKCHDLRKRMHSRVSSPRALRQYLFAGNPSNDRGNCALHCDGIGLHLPAGKFRSVIGDDHFEIAHAAIFRVAVRGSIIEATESFGSNLPVPGARRNFNRVLVRYTEWFPRNSVSRVGLSNLYVPGSTDGRKPKTKTKPSRARWFFSQLSGTFRRSFTYPCLSRTLFWAVGLFHEPESFRGTVLISWFLNERR